jgi:hypothetical protein
MEARERRGGFGEYSNAYYSLVDSEPSGTREGNTAEEFMHVE